MLSDVTVVLEMRQKYRFSFTFIIITMKFVQVIILPASGIIFSMPVKQKLNFPSPSKNLKMLDDIDMHGYVYICVTLYFL